MYDRMFFTIISRKLYQSSDSRVKQCEIPILFNQTQNYMGCKRWVNKPNVLFMLILSVNQCT